MLDSTGKWLSVSDSNRRTPKRSDLQSDGFAAHLTDKVRAQGLHLFPCWEDSTIRPDCRFGFLLISRDMRLQIPLVSVRRANDCTKLVEGIGASRQSPDLPFESKQGSFPTVKLASPIDRQFDPEALSDASAFGQRASRGGDKISPASGVRGLRDVKPQTRGK